MYLYTLSFLIGICCAQLLKNLPSFSIVLAIFIASFVFLFLNKIIVRIYFKYFIIIFSGICTGFSWISFYAALQLKNSLPEKIENVPLILSGYISSIPKLTSYGLSFNFDVKKTKIISENKKLNWKGEIHLYLNQNLSSNLNICCSVGQMWQFVVKLKRPHGYANEGNVDRERFAFQKNVVANGHVLKRSENTYLKNDTFYKPVEQLRQKILAKLDDQLSHEKSLPFLKALTLGDEQFITSEQWDVLRLTGTSHLISISGLHLAMVVSVVWFLLKKIGRLYLAILLHLSIQRFAAIGAIIFAMFYALLSGFSLPIQRALIMLCVFMNGVIFNRYFSSWRSFYVSLFLILVLEPLAVLSFGFWLSFFAVFWILYAIVGRIKQNRKLFQSLKIQIFVTLGLIFPSLFFFQKISLISIPANLIAIPWTEFLVVPFGLIGCLFIFIYPSLGILCLKFSALCMDWLWKILVYLAELPHTQFVFPLLNIEMLIVGCAAFMILLFPKGWPLKWLSFLWMFIVFFTQPPKPKTGEIFLTILDVGQGLSAVIRTRHHTLVYDTGPKLGELDTAQIVLNPYLFRQCIKKIDVLVLSHEDLDHSGGTQTFLKQFKVNKIFTNFWKNKLPNFKSENCHLSNNNSWMWDEVKFEFLSLSILNKNILTSSNDDSCVLKITTGNNSVLLPGDIEEKSETFLVENFTVQKLRSDILIAPHHGSKSSSTNLFIETVSPQFVIFSTGYKNHFNFPNVNIVNRYQKNHAKIYNTAKSGEIQFEITKEEIKMPIEWRQQNKHYWMM